MCRRIIIIVFGLFVWGESTGQTHRIIPTPDDLPQAYPRIYVSPEDKSDLIETVADEEWATGVVSGIHDRIDEHVYRHEKDKEWMISRLQMYWNTKATDVYIDGIYYSHASGKAPVPTVRYSGSRDPVTPYKRPKLEDIQPYMDDERGLFFHNTSKEGNPLEWVEQSKTGKQIESINQEIIGYGRDAAFLYWLEEDDRFAEFAFDLFDTYMDGMYYRSEPIDISNSHIQTLVGLSSFQVIHEGILQDLSILYDFLHGYIETNHGEEIAGYEETFKKWIDLIIQNGVPQNNWNLHQAKHILKVAMVLRDNVHYEDGKGREYYIDYLLNQTSARQWSLTKFMDYGYDLENGVWAECPGYSQGVTNDLTHFIRDYYTNFDFNILPYTPVMAKAVKMLPQYLFPNGDITAFGDTYYGAVSTGPMEDMIWMAQQTDDEKMEEEFTAMYRLFEPNAEKMGNKYRPRPEISSLFSSKQLSLDPAYKKGELTDYLTQTFYAPNVSWHVQRIGQDPKNGMMVSMVGSLGNHMHANGISVELYGKGYVQGAESGRGSSYFQPDYLEYYSQFPAHNTVMVDGISSYPEMLSNHAFDLNAEYPLSGKKEGYYPSITFSDVYFLEPESQSDQRRQVSIVKTSESRGYYVDIFRSKKQREGDKFHDYFYHNLGQSMTITDEEGEALKLVPSDEMAFAGGHLFALDYQWDKKSITTNEDYQAEWKIAHPDGEDVYMNLWMKGTKGREVFSLKSPPTKAFRKSADLPYDASKEPFLTIAARQHGEAWEHPFVSVYEPYTSSEGKSIASIDGFEDENGNSGFVGIKITHKSGREDLVFSSADGAVAKFNGISTDASYALVGKEADGRMVLFLGDGNQLELDGYSLTTTEKGTVVMEVSEGSVMLHNEVTVKVTKEGKSQTIDPGDFRKIKF
ncbi:hypothetical protein DN752_23075 [Echinicola strongylocentroti]|uniref:Heparinase II/III-like protein n=2 Tax=Echinicola strongylocentroti TaxID=1795355 RepID=A0A2Z4IR63_9BACT|nr:hypothetical protein DN752_23075 [Echinicola strongylocentroti]